MVDTGLHSPILHAFQHHPATPHHQKPSQGRADSILSSGGDVYHSLFEERYRQEAGPTVWLPLGTAALWAGPRTLHSPSLKHCGWIAVCVFGKRTCFGSDFYESFPVTSILAWFVVVIGLASLGLDTGGREPQFPMSCGGHPLPVFTLITPGGWDTPHGGIYRYRSQPASLPGGGGGGRLIIPEPRNTQVPSYHRTCMWATRPPSFPMFKPFPGPP